MGVVLQEPSFEANLTVDRALELYGLMWGMPGEKRRDRARELLEKFELVSFSNMKNDELSIYYYRYNQSDMMTLSQEVSLNQIKNLDIDLYDVEYRVYGYTEMMISEYCPMGVLTKSCKKNKRDSQCSKSDYYLESSDMRMFRLAQDENCRTTIYSDSRVHLLEDLEPLIDEGINKFELDFSYEDSDEVRNITSAYVASLKLGARSKPNIAGSDTGHLYKEID